MYIDILNASQVDLQQKMRNSTKTYVHILKTNYVKIITSTTTCIYFFPISDEIIQLLKKKITKKEKFWPYSC